MFTGVATIGILAGSLASLFRLGEQKQAGGEPQPMQEELEALRSQLQAVHQRLGELSERAQPG
jgi:hypothetical protein